MVISSWESRLKHFSARQSRRSDFAPRTVGAARQSNLAFDDLNLLQDDVLATDVRPVPNERDLFVSIFSPSQDEAEVACSVGDSFQERLDRTGKAPARTDSIVKAIVSSASTLARISRVMTVPPALDRAGNRP